MSGTRPPRKEAKGSTSAKQKRSLPSLTAPQKIVYVKVGREKTAFGIHLELACFHSSYLKAAFTGGFSEASTGEIVLENTRPEIFGIFVHWMYTQEILTTVCDDLSLGRVQREGKDLPNIAHLFELWVLADYLQAPQLQNKSLDNIKQRTIAHKYYPLDALRIPFEKTLQGSMARKFVIDLLCWSSITARKLYKYQESVTAEMFIDLFVAERDRRMAVDPRNPLDDMSNYYVRSSYKK